MVLGVTLSVVDLYTLPDVIRAVEKEIQNLDEREFEDTLKDAQARISSADGCLGDWIQDEEGTVQISVEAIQDLRKLLRPDLARAASDVRRDVQVGALTDLMETLKQVQEAQRQTGATEIVVPLEVYTQFVKFKEKVENETVYPTDPSGLL